MLIACSSGCGNLCYMPDWGNPLYLSGILHHLAIFHLSHFNLLKFWFSCLMFGFWFHIQYTPVIYAVFCFINQLITFWHFSFLLNHVLCSLKENAVLGSVPCTLLYSAWERWEAHMTNSSVIEPLSF